MSKGVLRIIEVSRNRHVLACRDEKKVRAENIFESIVAKCLAITVVIEWLWIVLSFYNTTDNYKELFISSITAAFFLDKNVLQKRGHVFYETNFL